MHSVINKITGISDKELMSASNKDSVLTQFHSWIHELNIEFPILFTAFNVDFDKLFLETRGWLDNYWINWPFCIMKITKQIMQKYNALPYLNWLKDYKNPKLIEAYNF